MCSNYSIIVANIYILMSKSSLVNAKSYRVFKCTLKALYVKDAPCNDVLKNESSNYYLTYQL